MIVQSQAKEKNKMFKKLLNYSDIYVVDLDKLNEHLIQMRKQNNLNLQKRLKKRRSRFQAKRKKFNKLLERNSLP